MTLSSTSNTPQLLQENITSYGALLQLNQSQEIHGQTCIKCNEYKPITGFGTRANAFGTRFLYNICKKCHSQAASSRSQAARKIFGNDRKVQLLIRDNKPPEGTPCDCCGRPMLKKEIQFDHDHITSTFRGWICRRCNGGIGQLGDTIEGLEIALEYLKQTTQL